jgi:hypothetical protein
MMPGGRRRPPIRAPGLAFLLPVLARAAAAATWHVATTGKDSNPGTAAAPFASLQRGVDAAGPGDTILVGDGAYGFSGARDSMAVTIAKAGASRAWITLQALHPGKAILDCRLTCHSYINLAAASAYWAIRGFEIRNGRWGGIFSNSGGGRNILVQGNKIHHIGNRPEDSPVGITGIYTDAGASNFRVDGNVIGDVGRTTNRDGRHDHGIYSHGGLIITNNTFYNPLNGWHIQTADGFHGTIAGNAFYGSAPATSTAGQVMLWGAVSNLLVRGNSFYSPRSSAIATYEATFSGSCGFEQNTVFGPMGPSLLEALPPGCTERSTQFKGAEPPPIPTSPSLAPEAWKTAPRRAH